MKIAVFYNLDFGGAKRAVFEQVKGLKKLGHSVDVVTTDTAVDAFDPAAVADSIYKYPFSLESNVRFVSDYKNFVALKTLHRSIALDIDARGYDIVLAHPDKFTQAPFLLRFLQTKSVYYCQEPLRIAYEYNLRFQQNVDIFRSSYEQLTRLYRKKIDTENVRSATFTLASCYHIRERMIEAYGVFPKVAYLGVDEKVFHPLHVKKKRQVLFVGSKENQIDGYDLAQKAVSLIPAKIRPALKVLSWQKENGKRLTEKDLVKLYNESIATLSVSRFETFGFVPLESMASGTPVIATNVSGHRETVADGKSGFLVDFDAGQIAQKIQFLMNDSKVLEQISRGARGWIEQKWTWDKQNKHLEQLLREFAGK